MKNFDLAAAKAGAPVCTREGVSARIICTDRHGCSGRIIALLDRGGREGIEFYYEDGRFGGYGNNERDLMMRDDDYAEKLARGEYGPTVKENLTVDTPTCKDSLPVDRVACRREFAEKVMLKIIDGIVCHGGKNLDDNGSIYSSAAYDAVAYTDALLAELQTKKTEK